MVTPWFYPGHSLAATRPRARMRLIDELILGRDVMLAFVVMPFGKKPVKMCTKDGKDEVQEIDFDRFVSHLIAGSWCMPGIRVILTTNRLRATSGTTCSRSYCWPTWSSPTSRSTIRPGSTGRPPCAVGPGGRPHFRSGDLRSNTLRRAFRPDVGLSHARCPAARFASVEGRPRCAGGYVQASLLVFGEEAQPHLPAARVPPGTGLEGAADRRGGRVLGGAGRVAVAPGRGPPAASTWATS